MGGAEDLPLDELIQPGPEVVARGEVGVQTGGGDEIEDLRGPQLDLIGCSRSQITRVRQLGGFLCEIDLLADHHPVV